MNLDRHTGKLYKMKQLLSAIILFSMHNLFSQVETGESEINLFAQGILQMESDQEMIDLEREMRMNPYVQVVRLDRASKRFFLLSVGLEELSEEDLRSWFGKFGDQVKCVQIGVQGVDAVSSFPFVNCPN